MEKYVYLILQELQFLKVFIIRSMYFCTIFALQFLILSLTCYYTKLVKYTAIYLQCTLHIKNYYLLRCAASFSIRLSRTSICRKKSSIYNNNNNNKKSYVGWQWRSYSPREPLACLGTTFLARLRENHYHAKIYKQHLFISCNHIFYFCQLLIFFCSS